MLEPGDGTAPETLRSFVAGRLAEFMVPAEVRVIDEMPFKGPGKVDRELLRMRAITGALVEQVPFFRHASAAFLRDMGERPERHTIRLLAGAKEFGPGKCAWSLK